MGQVETISHDYDHGREGQMLTQDLWSEIRFMRKMKCVMGMCHGDGVVDNLMIKHPIQRPVSAVGIVVKLVYFPKSKRWHAYDDMQFRCRLRRGDQIYVLVQDRCVPAIAQFDGMWYLPIDGVKFYLHLEQRYDIVLPEDFSPALLIDEF